MSTSVEIKGSLVVGGDGCGSSCGGGSAGRVIQPLALRCATEYYDGAVEGTPRVNTVGAIGAEWSDIDLLGDLTYIELVYVSSSGPMGLRIGALEATVLGNAATFPTGFAGGETLDLNVDGVAFAATFLIGDQSAAQVLARINAAAALAGLDTPVATLESTGNQIRLTGHNTGAPGATVNGNVTVTGGSAATPLGLAGKSGVGAGADVRVDGIILLTPGRGTDAPSRIQASGQAQFTVIAAGRMS